MGRVLTSSMGELQTSGLPPPYRSFIEFVFALVRPCMEVVPQALSFHLLHAHAHDMTAHAHAHAMCRPQVVQEIFSNTKVCLSCMYGFIVLARSPPACCVLAALL